ncbi:ABC transporter ATP-binding protein [Singulisphaera sp. PoT]|uniref:ABC transporter ATP-binding protein n=1 Tax=Singulisphaera sp. PoT TaxID=3411797 RepID=UPI003BF5675D
MTGEDVLSIRGLTVRNRRDQRVIDEIALTLRAGEVTALVGETGSGKTTLLNSVLGLLPNGLDVTAGEVVLDGEKPVELLRLEPRERRRHLGVRIGYVPQDVRSGLNPLMTAEATVAEAARRVGGDIKGRVTSALLRAGLSEQFAAEDAKRRPGKLSGGQCQRILIAQAIVNGPRVLLLDEPTASLDPPTRREVQATIRRLADDRCAVCLVTHDISALAGLADSVAVMYLGRIVESGPAEDVLRNPAHPYTAALLNCVPRLDRRERILPIPGELPTNHDEIEGCRFHPRCRSCVDRCRIESPHLLELEARPARRVACHVVGPVAP